MSDHDHVSSLMAEIGPRADLLHVRHFPDSGTWMLVVDETAVVGAEIDVERGLVVFWAEIGALPEAGAEKILRFALAYSMLWHANDGLHVGLDMPSGVLRLMASVAIGRLDAERLGATIRLLAGRLPGWRKLLAHRSGETEDVLALGSRLDLIRI